MYNKEKILFEHGIQSKINGLNFQRERIFNVSHKEFFKKGISPMHDVDFYVIILNRLGRELSTRKYNPKIRDIITKNENFLNKIKIRHDFEHPTEDKMVFTEVSNLPAGAISAPSGFKMIIYTSLVDNVIVSGDWRWDLHKDHELFISIIKEFMELYLFS